MRDFEAVVEVSFSGGGWGSRGGAGELNMAGGSEEG